VTRGTLLVFEGIDGSGKSTQLTRLAARLEGAGHRVVPTREPYDCEPGRRIRAAARAGEAVSAAQELRWFRAQREVHVREVIAPALAQGAVVLCDRYFLSTAAYQGARGLDPEAILRESEAAFPVPDLVILLEVDPAEGGARIAARGGPAEPLFEDAARQVRVAALFAAMERPYLVRVDGRASPDAVADRVADVVRARTGLL
jgi:dTMP kinase